MPYIHLVERRANPQDRRSYDLFITPEGTKELAHLKQLSKQAEDEFFASITDNQRSEYIRLTRKLVEKGTNCD